MNRRPWWLPLLALVLLLASAPAARAHKPSDAYLRWQVDGAVVEQRIDIALRDLDRELALDADGDTVLRWGEVRTRWAEIAAVAAAGVRWQADGRDCRAEATEPPALDRHVDGAYAVLRQRFRCPAPVQRLDVDYRMFAGRDATHRGLARIDIVSSAGNNAGDAGTASATTVLVPGAGVQRIAVGAPETAGSGQAAAGEGGGSAFSRFTDAVRESRFTHFVREGMHHIASGLDHLLFLATLLAVVGSRREHGRWVPNPKPGAAWRETLQLVTAFTVSHSLTLGLAAAGVLAPPSRWVETLIALSVLAAALDNLRPFVPGPRWAMVSVFGLVHGFGFAGPLQDLGLTRGALAVPLLGFNLGVELGQLIVVALLLPIALLMRQRPGLRGWIVRGGSTAVALLALLWTIERGFGMS
ncbi:MAG: HupE/UreJ family protein [Rubrivivax sp.]